MPLLSKSIARTRQSKALGLVRGDVLELGCADGRLYGLCRERIGRYVGVDYSETALARARERYPEANFLKRNIEHEELGFEAEFDSILMVALIEHIFNQGFLLGQCARALRPGGRIVLTTPTPFGNDVVHRIGAPLGLFHRSAMDDHIVIYNKKRLQTAAKEFGLVLDRYETFQLGCNQLAVLEKRVE
ncbi:MAG: class I SAM-dependent methyltransferase [Rhodovibrionaceae bacterium]